MKEKKLGSLLNFPAGQEVKFFQHMNPYRGILLAHQIQIGLGRLLITLTWYLNIDSAMSLEKFCHRKMSSEDYVTLMASAPPFINSICICSWSTKLYKC